MKRLFLISLDLLAALPILCIASALVLSSISSSQNYLLALGESRGTLLNAIVASQQIAVELDAGPTNYSQAASMAGTIASTEGLSAQLLESVGGASCSGPSSFCRLVTVSGDVYLLVVSYANAS
ncbi:MAG: hypothetical protein KGI04_00220 [Candidatus Micrarchaeota archaeon]|nr:hypothetical protein [Candidatus Micrarchaeota archaeon]